MAIHPLHVRDNAVKAAWTAVFRLCWWSYTHDTKTHVMANRKKVVDKIDEENEYIV